MSKFIKGIIIVLGVLGSGNTAMTPLTFLSNRGYAEEFTIPAPAIVNLNTATLNVPGTITVASSGTLQSSTGTITVSNNGNWANSGTFTPGNSVVQFTGTSHTISGSSTFYNLKCEIPGGTINFEVSKRQTISNTLTLTGATGNRLNLRSSSDGTQWEIDPQGTRNVDFLDIKDAKNVNSTAISVNNSTNSGNNTNWIINGVSTEPVPEPGPTPFVLLVTSRSPSSGATGISITTTINATFNDNINGSTVTTNTFMVSGGGATVAGAVSTNGSSVTFTPSGNLANNTTYTATITTGVQAANAAGTSLSSNYSWSFTTVSAGISTPTPTPTAKASPTPISTASPTPPPTLTPSPTPTPVPTEGLFLSKYIAYLSGDTIVATVIDADRNTGATFEDTLTTAIKVTGSNYSIGTDLLLDLKEDSVNSGTFLATIKTGTATIGGASSSTRANIGILKAIQGGKALVIYTDTIPGTSTLTKTLSLSSFDATLVFNANTYSLDSYAGITLADAERNANHTEAESLLNDVFIETSSFNITRLKLIETGADTGTFVSSIQVAASGGTLEFDRIQATVGDTLRITYNDEVNTTRSVRVVTDTASVVEAVVPTPTVSPLPSPAVTPSITPTPVVCEAEKLAVSPSSLNLKRKKRGDVTVTVTGADGCAVEGETVTASINAAGKKRISISPTSDSSDENGKAIFKVRAKKAGKARITFKTEKLKKSIAVKVKK